VGLALNGEELVREPRLAGVAVLVLARLEVEGGVGGTPGGLDGGLSILRGIANGFELSLALGVFLLSVFLMGDEATSASTGSCGGENESEEV
jgi:hypothetical protein